MRQDPAVGIPAQVSLDKARDGIAVRLGLPHAREPGLQVPLDHLVNDGLFRLSEAGRPSWGASGPREATVLSGACSEGGCGRHPCRILG
ncbi:MAG: hypothetical protein ACREA0_08715, partial [bacterium]